jgi:Fe-S cluster biogenesis protein NfuA
MMRIDRGLGGARNARVETNDNDPRASRGEFRTEGAVSASIRVLLSSAVGLEIRSPPSSFPRMSMWKREPGGGAAVELRIRRALVEMRPLLRIESVGIELVQFEEQTGVAVLRFQGDCPDCQMSASMLRAGVEAHLRMQVPEIRGVRAV